MVHERTKSAAVGRSELLERWILDAVELVTRGGPPRLDRAIRDATFPGGARLRPNLVVAVAEACGAHAEEPDVVAAASAIELFHCASLVHDDLPCFDDAPLRRGLPSVHRKHGEAMALLAGDALLIGGFQVLSARASAAHLPALLATFASALGASRGIVAGQAWESEPDPGVHTVHLCKTAALFEAATIAGAIAAGGDGARFRDLGRSFGLAYQLLDDLSDCQGDATTMGKATGRDRTLGRPNAALLRGRRDAELGATAAIDRVVQAIPPVPRREALVTFVESAWARATERAGIDLTRSISFRSRSPRLPLERAG
jgi:geranylgeranyl diphosphate synthase, type II